MCLRKTSPTSINTVYVVSVDRNSLKELLKAGLLIKARELDDLDTWSDFGM